MPQAIPYALPSAVLISSTAGERYYSQSLEACERRGIAMLGMAGVALWS
jgi:hypothetical protein